MNDKSIVRTTNFLGQIAIPKETLKMLHIKNGDPIEIYSEENKLILKKYSRKCIFCEGSENLSKFKNKYICAACKEKIREKFVVYSLS